MAINLITTSSSVAGTNVTANGGTLTYIAAGVIRSSTVGTALANLAASDNCDVRVDGTLIGNGTGVSLTTDGTSDNHSLLVGATGIVQGYGGYGATVNGTNASIYNLGEIASFSGTAVVMTGSSAELTNFGTISSISGSAVLMSGFYLLVQNHGAISAGGTIGLNVTGALGSAVRNFGTISGSTTSILGSANFDLVQNSGTLIGLVSLDAGNDIFNGTAGGAVTVAGGSGNDTLRGSAFEDDLRGDDGNDRLVGGAGEDSLQGGIGLDRLQGGADDDRLIGGAEADTMSGGSGDDVFLFSSLLDLGNALTADRITDFASGDDVINLDPFGLTFIGNAAFGAVAGQVRYAKGIGQLQVDQNGDGVLDFFLQFDKGTVLVATDLIL